MNIKGFQNRIVKYAWLAALSCWIISFPFTGLNNYFGAGLFLGIFTATLNFYLLCKDLITALQLEESAAKKRTFKTYWLRLFFSALTFLLAYHLGGASMIGWILGILSFKLSIYGIGMKTGKEME